MNDAEVLKQIQALVDEERHLLEPHPDGEHPPGSHDRLKSIEIDLDQCWDLLRQRRALRETGANPDQAQVRDATTVERYQQ